MKCPRCGRDMQRIKSKEHSYFYECPRCHKRIGGGAESKKEEKDQSAS